MFGSQNIRRQGRESRENGATMAEAAIVLVILITLILGVMEVSRYYTLKAQMTRAVRSALELAIRNDHLLLEPSFGDTEEIAKLRKASFEAGERAEHFPVGQALLAEAFSPTLGVATLTYTADSFLVFSDMHVNLLRPGENGVWIHPETRELIAIDHATYPPPAPGTAKRDMIDLMREHPIHVEMNGWMDSIVPFLGRIHVRAEALGMAELPPIGIEAVPGDPEFAAPGCGDGVYTPGAEECDRVGAIHLGVKDFQYCTYDCRKRHRCGNGKKDDNGSYHEQCDGQDGVTEFETRCNNSCKLVPIPRCANGRCDPGEDCDRKASLEDDDDSDDACAPPPGSSCVQLEEFQVEGLDEPLCKIVLLPDCEGQLKIVKCGVDDRFECLVCVGEGGTCGNGTLDDGELCDIATNENVTLLPGVDPKTYCDGCTRIVDRCGNGIYDGTVGSYFEECDIVGGSPVGFRTINDSEYCETSECKIKPKCGNGRVDPAYGSYPAEQCDDEKFNSITTAERDDGYYCDQCVKKLAPCIASAEPCADGSQPIWVPGTFDSQGNVLVEGRCDCPAEIGS